MNNATTTDREAGRQSAIREIRDDGWTVALAAEYLESVGADQDEYDAGFNDVVRAFRETGRLP